MGGGTLEDEVRNHPIGYTGMAAGAASEVQGFVTDYSLYKQILNPLELDHVMHGWFNIGLARLSDKTLDYAMDHPSLTQKAMFSGAVMIGFTLAKEYGLDGTADYMDMVGNAFGWSLYRGSDYGWQNLKQDTQAFGQQLYNAVR